MSTTRMPASAPLIVRSSVCYAACSSVGRRRDDVFVAMTLADQARVLEDVERHLEGRARDLDVWRPAAELLVIGDRRGEHSPIDLREECRLGFRNFGRRRGDEPSAGLSIRAHESPRGVRPKPLARRGEAREGARPIASPTEATTW